MKSFDTKDLKVSNGKFESSHRKDQESECSPDAIDKVSSRKFESSHMGVFEDPEVSSRRFESFESKVLPNDSSTDTDSEDSSRNFESFASKESANLRIDLRSKPRTV